MDDEEDVKKMIELIKSSKEDTTQDFQYDDFINCENSDVEECEETTYYDNNYDFSNSVSTDISKLNSYDPRSTLKPEERFIIDSCSNQELKNVLLLNRTKNFQLMQLYKKLKDLLIQCQKEIKEKKEVITNFMRANKEQAHSSGAWRLAAPYFKDKKLYACPPNVDTLRKQANKELNVYDFTITLKWTSLECDKLLRAVKLNYNINQQNDVLKKIKTLQQSEERDGEKFKELESRMEELQNEANSEIPPLNSDKFIDWMRVAEVFLQDRRTSFECKSFWHVYLHPDINKLPWTPEENTKLKKLTKKYKYQNWDQIAAELANNRTGFTCCMNYFSNVHQRFKKGEFTNDEDMRLVQLVHRHKMGNYIPWVKIVQYFKRRTRAQLHYRYTYYLTQNDKKKGKFTDAEDILLMILVDRFGKNFKKCSEHLPTRSMVQIKSRYNTNLQQKLKKGSFTKQDDEIIMKYAKEHGQKSWAKLTKILQRCRGQIRQRYNTIVAYLDKYPNLTLAEVPRRRHNLLEGEDPFNFLRMVADQFADSPNIPTLSDIEKVLQNHQKKDLTEDELESINIFSNPVSIDNMLTNFFCNSFKMNPTKCISSTFLKRAAKDVNALLDVLKADIEIPPNFDEDIRLDNLDVAILNILVDETSYKNKFKKDICELIPPNLNSVVGLRSLLIKYYTHKGEETEERKSRLTVDIKSDIVKHLISLPPGTRMNVENERKLFYKRFHVLFKWPAIITLVNPSPDLQGSSSNSIVPKKIQVERTYSKADKNKTKEINTSKLASSSTKVVPPTLTPVRYKRALGDSIPNQNKNEINITELPSSSTKAVPLTLTPVVNKSVLEDLMRNQNKKLFSMEAVKSDGGTKMVIREVNFRLGNSKLKGVNKTEMTGAATSDDSYEPSAKKMKSSRFLPDHGECIILNTDEDDYDYISSGDESTDSVKDNLNDLNKLESFLEHYGSKETPKNDDDLEDLKKLESFLKEQETRA